MRAYRETFRRHRVLYLLPALVAAVVVGFLSHKAPTYVATGSLWVDNQASSASSLTVAPGNNQAAPSGAEQTVLNELLTTRKFDAAVIAGAGLGHADANSPLLQLVQGVTSSTPGPQVLQVSSIAPSPTVAYKIVKSVITQLQGFSQQWAHDFASSAIAYYQTQVANATHAVAQAKATTGPTKSATLSTATSALAAATGALSQAQAQANGHGGFSTNMVLGEPSSDSTPLTGYKSLLMKALGAAAAALLLSALVIVVRTPSGHDAWDDAIDSMSDSSSIEDGTASTSAAIDAAPVPPSGTLTPPGPLTAPISVISPAAESGVSHALRRGGLLTRKMVMHQPPEHVTKPVRAAEGEAA